ncbi:hypothetical protein A6K76_03380 [Caryophanon latum]|uniref:Uncharacterized protein n=1 Tax=Caryophanon latum TaxID=33977 RepID=A0A1C0Y8E1_9BACL|nr:hypothetical protein A6K76_03380 [Caryophanon latum]
MRTRLETIGGLQRDTKGSRKAMPRPYCIVFLPPRLGKKLAAMWRNNKTLNTVYIERLNF